MISNTRKALLGLAAIASVGAMAAPAQAQWRHGGYYGGYRHHGWNAGGAAAAGLVGGLALGALATRPAYGYGYGAYPAYGYGYGGCYIERQRVYDAWGRPMIRRVRVCD
ncbi:hypothetical protein SLNSH_07005 [Alsobacter soli]|uniref:Sulfur globule protein n=1 Tax=Alsobacter soli TaxID=2109933 RepID=A0A2T1HVP2_9HYPH|nr:hypothetical protein [Alsobacter soli]PSC05721.1 hypothetical protein SLNSH_07005 [Alsobacter soli]